MCDPAILLQQGLLCMPTAHAYYYTVTSHTIVLASVQYNPVHTLRKNPGSAQVSRTSCILCLAKVYINVLHMLWILLLIFMPTYHSYSHLKLYTIVGTTNNASIFPSIQIDVCFLALFEYP